VTTPPKEALLAAIERQEEMIRDLDRQRDQSLVRLADLRERLAADNRRRADPSARPALVPPPRPRAAEAPPPLTGTDKLRLFRELFRGREERLLLATGRYIGEGFDDARLDTLFLALPISFKGTLVQYTGRLHRLHPNKTEVRIFDYVDRSIPMLLRMFDNRLRGYRAIGYARDEAPLGFAPPPQEPTIEYDEEALRHFDDEE
jgi:hypothetical protein